MSVDIDIEKCIGGWLETALGATSATNGMLSLKEFILITEFKVDKWSLDKFFHNINDEVAIYLDEPTIRWFGYAGCLDKQKEKIKLLLKKNFAKHENKYWFDYSNKEYKQFYDTNIPSGCAHPDVFYGKNKTKHMLIHPYIFKCIIMMADTTSRHRIMDYYLALEDLNRKYFTYQCAARGLSYQTEYDEIANSDLIILHTRRQSIKYLEISLDERYRCGCVYHIQESDTEYVKIGWCYNLPIRLAELQVGNPRRLSVVKYELCQFAYDREQELHAIHKSHHISGEWFAGAVLD